MPPDDALKRLANIGKPGAWIVSAVERVQESTGMGRNDPGKFHPSAFGNPCDAFLAFRFLGAPAVQVIRARLQRIFDNGSGRDDYLKRDFQKAGISLIKKEADRHISIPHLFIEGDLDDWIINPMSKRKAVIDFKTMNSSQWAALEEVRHSHHLQVHPYMYGKETYEGFVLYENKDNQDWKIQPANFDGQIWQTEIVDRISSIIEGIRHNTVHRNPVDCGNCPFFANGVCASNQIQQLREVSGIKI